MQNLRGWRTFFLVCVFVFAGNVVCQAASLVISQIYTGSRGPYGYVELFNRSTDPVIMDGWTLQTSPADPDAVWTKFPLSGTIAPGQYYLIRVATTASRAGAPAPDTDLLGLPIVNSGGQLAIVQNDTLLPIVCTPPGAFSQVMDFVTWGSSPCGAQAAGWQETVAMVRTKGGCIDSSGLSFILAAPAPRNSQSITNLCGVAAAAALQSYSVFTSGGFSMTTSGAGSKIVGGSARVEPASGSTNPTGFAIFGLRQSGTLISEASVPATVALQSGFFFVDITGFTNTGVAIANMNSDPVDIQYQYTDAGSGAVTQTGTVTIAPNTQIARFMNELPFALGSFVQGTLTFSATEPISIIALRGTTNSRGEFLVTTLPVTNGSAPVSTAASYVAHFAVNNGWKTDLILICPGPLTCSGNVNFRDATGAPVTIKADTLVANTFQYNLVAFGSEKVAITGLGDQVSGGTIQISPSSNSPTPVATAVFSYSRNNITVSEAGVNSALGTAFTTYVEYSGQVGAIGSIQPGVAIANSSNSATTVNLSLNRLDGTSTGLSTPLTIPPNGQVAKFVNELFPTLNAPFQGIMTVTSTGGPIAVIGLRGHYNERRDFLITTVPAVDQSVPVSNNPLVFPHIVDSGGYTTQFVLFGPTGQGSSGNLRFATTGGQPLALQFK